MKNNKQYERKVRIYIHGRIKSSVCRTLQHLLQNVELVSSEIKKKPKKIHTCSCGKHYVGSGRQCIECRDKKEEERDISFNSYFLQQLNRKQI